MTRNNFFKSIVGICVGPLAGSAEGAPAQPTKVLEERTIAALAKIYRADADNPKFSDCWRITAKNHAGTLEDALKKRS